MIKSFKCKETEKIFSRLFSKKLPQNIQRSALKKLWMLNRSVCIDDFKVPPNDRTDIITWRYCPETEKANKVSGSTINGGFALNGMETMPLMWK